MRHGTARGTAACSTTGGCMPHTRGATGPVPSSKRTSPCSTALCTIAAHSSYLSCARPHRVVRVACGGRHATAPTRSTRHATRSVQHATSQHTTLRFTPCCIRHCGMRHAPFRAQQGCDAMRCDASQRPAAALHVERRAHDERHVAAEVEDAEDLLLRPHGCDGTLSSQRARRVNAAGNARSDRCPRQMFACVCARVCVAVCVAVCACACACVCMCVYVYM